MSKKGVNQLIEEVGRARSHYDPGYYYSQEGRIRGILGKYLTNRVVSGFQPDKWQDRTVIFFPRHLSQFDPFPLGFSIHELNQQAELGMDPPSFLAGTNLFLGPYGTYLKRMKAIPLYRQRMGRNDPYRFAFCKKVTDLMAAGEHVIIFPEAGRSDDGLLKEFKKTFIHCATDAQKHSERPILIQPVSIVYDFVPETKYHHLLKFARDNKKNHKTLEYMYYGIDIGIFSRPYFFPDPVGNFYINFGEPRTVKSLRISWSALEKPVKFQQHVSDYTEGQIIENQAVPPTALVAHCIHPARSMTRSQLQREVAESIDDLTNHGYNVVAFADLEMDPVSYALDIFESKGLVRQKHGIVYVRKPKSLRYCANTVSNVMHSLEKVMQDKL